MATSNQHERPPAAGEVRFSGLHLSDDFVAWLFEGSSSRAQPDAEIDTTTGPTVQTHSDKAGSASSAGMPTQNSAEFSCGLCRKTFSRKFNLNNHLKAHANERSFSCSICGLGFVRRHDRETHERLHTGEKKFICSGPDSHTGCGRSFARRSNFLRHIRSCKRAAGAGALEKSHSHPAVPEETSYPRVEGMNVVPESISLKLKSSNSTIDRMVDSPPDPTDVTEHLEQVGSPTQASTQARTSRFDKILGDSGRSKVSCPSLRIISSPEREDVKATIRRIQKDRNLDILTWVGSFSNPLPGPKSWIVNRTFVNLISGKSMYHWHACGERHMVDPMPSGIPIFLSLRGVAFGIIQDTFMPRASRDWSKPPLSLANNWATLFRPDAERYITSSSGNMESMVSALAKTLANRFLAAPPEAEALRSAADQFQQWLASDMIPVGEDLAQLRRKITIAKKQDPYLLPERTLTMTTLFRAGPYLGIMDYSPPLRRIRRGDICCVLFGGRLPFILRPVGDYFRLVANCYIHGAMEGEIVVRMEAGELKEQLFTLC